MDAGSKLSLQQAIRAYWIRLLLSLLFAPFLVVFSSWVGGGYLSVGIVFALFVALSLYVEWPIFQGRVRWSYWLFATLLFAVGGYLLVLLPYLFGSLLGLTFRGGA
jgi:hypothetical protein